jgi:hypothetical protein
MAWEASRPVRMKRRVIGNRTSNHFWVCRSRSGKRKYNHVNVRMQLLVPMDWTFIFRPGAGGRNLMI